MKSVLLLSAAIAFQSLTAAKLESISSLKPGDFVQVEYRWRNVDVPPTSSACPYITAQDAAGKTIFRRRVTDRGRRGFLPENCDIERWQVNFLVDERLSGETPSIISPIIISKSSFLKPNLPFSSL